MQTQDYLPYFQNLLLDWYHFTLANPVYAICLSISVWLLTAIFYSLRIGILNRRNRITIKAHLETQNAMAAAQQQIQLLQEEIAAHDEQFRQTKAEVEQETQRATALRERISQFGAQLTESLNLLSDVIDFNEQILSENPANTENFGQRLSAAIDKLNQAFRAKQQTIIDLQQTYNAQSAKLAEKEQQLQVMQIRFDSQSQLIAKLESTVAEHKTLLTQQQQNEQLLLSEIETKHQADLARLSALEQQALEWRQANQQQIQEKPKAQDMPIAQPKPAEPLEIQPQAEISEQKQEQIEASPSITEIPEQQSAKLISQTSSGVTGKLKNMFANAKQQIGKLDAKPGGQNTPVIPQEELAQTARLEPEITETATEIHISQSEPSGSEHRPQSILKDQFNNMAGLFKKRRPSSPQQPEAAVEIQKTESSNSGQQPQSIFKDPFNNMAGRFKKLLPSSKESPSNAAEPLDEKPLIEVEPLQPAKAPGNIPSDETGKLIPQQIKRIFGKIKGNR